MAKAKAKAKPKAPNAAKTLLAAVGKPDNINTVAVDELRCVRGWLKEDEPTRIRIVGELATALDKMRANKAVWEDIRTSAWNIKYQFTQMVALGKAIDRLLRARMRIDEATLTTLAVIARERADFSVLRLTAQLEHYGKTLPVGAKLRAAMVALAERNSWNAKLRARLSWLAAPAQPERVAQLQK